MAFWPGPRDEFFEILPVAEFGEIEIRVPVGDVHVVWGETWLTIEEALEGLDMLKRAIGTARFNARPAPHRVTAH